MGINTMKSEIRDSIIRELIDKVRKQNYKSYLASVRLESIRLFKGAKISFDFPVTALIGPNGGGKSTILGVCSCIYSSVTPSSVFRKSRIGDSAMDSWKIIFELIEKEMNPKGTITSALLYEKNQWKREQVIQRNVKFLGLNRTVPVNENPLFSFRQKLSIDGKGSLNSRTTIDATEVTDIDHIKLEAEKILGKSLSAFKLMEVTFTVEKHRHKRYNQSEHRELLDDGSIMIIRKRIEPTEIEVFKKQYSKKQYLYIGNNGQADYSEFNFGSGEASVIRMVADIESQPDSSLILIDEVENGLHPLAVKRLVEYLIDASKRKNLQVIFTTHSDYALSPLPSEAVWATIDGQLQQGKLSVEVLRAISGRVDKKLALFVEDDFAKNWIEVILREKLGSRLDEIGIYPVCGDGNAVKIHLNHNNDPSVQYKSLCFLDGDSSQKEDGDKGIFRLPGSMPETTVFNSAIINIANNLAFLTLACQRSIDRQNEVRNVILDVSHTK